MGGWVCGGGGMGDGVVVRVLVHAKKRAVSHLHCRAVLVHAKKHAGRVRVESRQQK